MGLLFLNKYTVGVYYKALLIYALRHTIFLIKTKKVSMLLTSIRKQIHKSLVTLMSLTLNLESYTIHVKE